MASEIGDVPQCILKVMNINSYLVKNTGAEKNASIDKSCWDKFRSKSF